MTRSKARLVVGVCAIALLTAACGARLNPSLRQQAADAQLKVGSLAGSGTDTGGTNDAPGTVNPTSGATAGPGTVNPTTGATTPGSVGSSTGSNGAGATSAPGTTDYHSLPAGGNGGATDVGVTATSISIGNVADQSGPVPGLFQSAAYGAQAYFAMINSQGGIYGRQLKLIAGDSQTDCNQTEAAYNNLIPKVLGFVGSFGLYDDCASSVLAQHPTIADVSYALSKSHRTLNNNFSPAPAPIGYTNGMFKYWAKEFPTQVQHVGTIYPDVPSAALSQRYFTAVSESVGWKYVYTGETATTQTTYQAELQQMKRAGVQLIFIAAENAGNTAEIKKEADQQGFKPIFISPVAYASDFISRLGSTSEAEGILGANLYSLFFNQDEAKNIPEVALYQKWMNATHPGQPLELYSMYSWAAANMYVQALIKVGPKPTRTAIFAALKDVHNFSDNGFVVPTDPGAKKAGVCYLTWKIHNGVFVRDNDPATGYRCDGTYYYYTGS